tara:strand:- start:3162 stop:4442 length:1281 start_codon:yes stop_codon:yes gene_type:complete
MEKILKIFDENKNHYFPVFIISLFPILFFLGSGVVNFFIIVLDIIFLLEIFLKKKTYLFKNIFFYLLTIFWLILLISLLFSIDIHNSLGRSLGFIRFIILVFAINYFINFENKKYQKIIFNFWTIIFIIISFDLIYEFVFGKNTLGFQSYMPGRLSGFFNDELKIGHLYSALIFITLSNIFFLKKNYLNIKNFFYNYIDYFLILIFLIISFIIGERSNFLKILIVLPIFVILVKKLNLVKKLIFLVSFFLVIFTISASNEIYKIRFWTMFVKPIIHSPINFINNTRYGQHYSVAIDVFNNNKLYGVGLKNYREEVKKEIYKKNSSRTRIASIHPHQVHFEFLSELGIVGYSYFLIFFLITIYISLKNYLNKKDNFQLSALLFILANLIPLIPSGSFFTTYSAALFWINFSIMMPSIIENKSYKIIN